MKISQALEQEILSVMEDYWSSYFSGKLERWAAYLPEDYRNIGTTQEEIWNSKQDIVDYTLRVLDQTVGKADFKNKTAEIIPYGPYFMVHELGDLYVKSEENWIFYAPFRLSSLIEKMGGKWLVHHQHGSFPDLKAAKGEAFGIDAVKAENERLKKAVEERTLELERQKRELEIEAALERVRTRTMAMHDSIELEEVAVLMYKEFMTLGYQSVQQCGYAVIREDGQLQDMWLTQFDGNRMSHFSLPLKSDALLNERYQAWKSGLPKFYQKVTKSAFLKHLQNVKAGINPQQIERARKSMPDPIHFYNAHFNHGYLHIVANAQLRMDEEAILSRFAKVFDQTYTRFLDLQKAESQARKAQIEASLERVRAHAMGLRQSNELEKIIEVIFEELQRLGLAAWECSIFFRNGNSRVFTVWGRDSTGDSILNQYQFPFLDHPILNAVLQDFERQVPYREILLEGEEIKSYGDLIFSETVFKDASQEYKDSFYSFEKMYAGQAMFKYGFLEAVGIEPLPGDFQEVLQRFAQVIDLAYTRFLDLQKAEKQAREAQIEVALERVRSRSMAMHSSSELADLSMELVKQVQNLGMANWFCAFNIEDGNPQGSLEWGSNGNMVFQAYRTPREGVFLKYHKAGLRGETLLVNEIPEEECPAHYDYLCSLPGVGDQLLQMKAAGIPFPTHQIDHVAYFKYGYLLFITYEQVPESHDIFIRFAKVFEQTYTRFLDLKNAEAQAKEAQIELSLERIRSKVSSMQESTELLDIMVNIRSEFVSLGHEAEYFWYMRWLPDKYEKAMTSMDGSQVGMIMTLPRHIHGDIPLVADWEKGQESTLVFPMDVETAIVYVDKMISLGDFELVDPHAPTLEDIRHIGGLTFVMARTSQGEIGYSLSGVVPNPPEEAVKTLARFAGVFDLAYARFEDLKKAERDLVAIKEAKQKAEEALAELKSAQAQLIQSEKMASLGELTAGIAHEIQNPLNFVNNFSEVSAELLEELKEELKKGDLEEADFILSDLRDNLTKINHHGKRAGSIVKGMLEHSRKSEGKKELVDLNALADECLKLGFHGLRAKDKTFSADFKANLAQGLPEISVVRQDIGRVMLNLINNAFYAVHDFGKTQGADFKPIVSIQSKLEGNQLEITVADNGKGIPDQILDKIFQPFFTTKPTGEGTGLGLSLSYDIIKAHGGDLTAKNLPEGGAQFKITLPIV